MTPGGGGDVTAFFRDGESLGARAGLLLAVFGGGVAHGSLASLFRVGDVVPDIPLIVVRDAGPAARSGVRLRGRTGRQGCCRT